MIGQRDLREVACGFAIQCAGKYTFAGIAQRQLLLRHIGERGDGIALRERFDGNATRLITLRDEPEYAGRIGRWREGCLSEEQACARRIPYCLAKADISTGELQWNGGAAIDADPIHA